MKWPAADEADCWLIDLTAGDLDLPAYLAADEQARAARFVHARDRTRFARSHVALRTILACYLQCDAAQIAYVNGVHGKPALVGSALNFNLSHSGDRAAVAVAAGEIGVDLEQRREVPNCTELAERYFPANEHHALLACEASERSAAFLVAWTRKEAWLKAAGVGLQAPLNRIEAGIEPSDAIVGDDTSRYRVITRTPAPLDIVSIAGPCALRRIRCLEYSEAPAFA